MRQDASAHQEVKTTKAKKVENKKEVTHAPHQASLLTNGDKKAHNILPT
jgi:hypothetical protein